MQTLRYGIISLLLCCSALPVQAAEVGPSTVAKANRQLWSEPVNTAAAFDKASRAAILVYAQKLQEMSVLTESEMLSRFKIKSVNQESVSQWLKQELAFSQQNYQFAAKQCGNNDWTCVDWSKRQGFTAPAALQSWRNNLSQFIEVYIAEQMRLAALFPRVSSEIATFNQNEWDGSHFADRQFFLSFDDGPTVVAGETDKTLKMLSEQKKSGIFFVLGENLQNRLNKTSSAKLSELYQNQCVASHGWQHQSHAKWTEWQGSVTRTHDLLKDSLPAANILPLFRPPYGQRKSDSAAFFQQQQIQVALWNLDSQDWNKQVDADDIVNRMLTLMLIKRHGMLLFHDVHAKANQALPVLFSELGSAVSWGDCHQLPASKS